MFNFLIVLKLTHRLRDISSEQFFLISALKFRLIAPESKMERHLHRKCLNPGHSCPRVAGIFIVLALRAVCVPAAAHNMRQFSFAALRPGCPTDHKVKIIEAVFS